MSHWCSGLKYSNTDLALNVSVPVKSSISSGQGFEDPLLSIDLLKKQERNIYEDIIKKFLKWDN